MRYKALHKSIIARKLEEDKAKPKSSIYIPDNAIEYKRYKANPIAQVIAISKDSEFKDQLKPGDYIIYMRNEGKKLKMAHLDHNVFNINDKWIMAKIDKQDIAGVGTSA